MKFLDDLAARQRFGMRLGLESIASLCAALGNPERCFPAIHVAGTNGKGAVSAILDAALRAAVLKGGQRGGLRIGRYTSPHLVRINERFFLDGHPVDDATLERTAEKVSAAVEHLSGVRSEPTFFEALTAVAFLLYAEAEVDLAVLECGLGGRLDATNVCRPFVSVITKIGLDHCDWLGDTVEKIAAEKAGIVKAGVPVVLGRNDAAVRAVIEARAKEVGAAFHYAPDLVDEAEIPSDFPLAGTFNRENAVTALATLKVLVAERKVRALNAVPHLPTALDWPGRFQQVGRFLVDGAHNPPAAQALANALRVRFAPTEERPLSLIAGFCGDKDVETVLATLAPLVRKGYAVRTNNARSLTAEETAERMRRSGIDATACASLADALNKSEGATLVCGSLFLAGEALVALNAYPWASDRIDPAERLVPTPPKMI